LKASNLDMQASPFHRPRLRVTPDSLEAHFASEHAQLRAPLPNPHHEPKVGPEERRRATPAAVLIPVVLRTPEPSLLLTRRSAGISHPGHIAFPGGRSDPGDASPEQTALREAEEEIGLARDRVRLIGRLGDYVTHSGFRIAPVVGLVRPPLDLVAHEAEVEEIVEVPLARVFDASSYRLQRVAEDAPRAYYSLEWDGIVVTGPTVSILMGLYDELVKTHTR
jgi:8-oxo-dGTP pyrophosphatase MutT (NUDIX family)